MLECEVSHKKHIAILHDYLLHELHEDVILCALCHKQTGHESFANTDDLLLLRELYIAPHLALSAFQEIF
ncbi:MAG: hypothetical protein CUN54_03480 [Phototrophicales bacterium]|nr:MAG: hypothetical protein CUN54_03480 [Phototrophicales bacterium]